MIETILIIVIGAGIGFYNEINKPTQYELNMEDGTYAHVILQKNNIYACPLRCEVEHIHQAVICKKNTQITSYETVYHITETNLNGISTFCSKKKILSMNKMAATGTLPDVISASKEK